MKKLILLFFVLCLILVSCKKNNKTDDKDPYAGRTLKVLSNIVGGKTPEEQKLFVDELEKHLGFKVDFIKPDSSYNNFVPQIFKFSFYHKKDATTEYEDIVLRVLSSRENYDLVNITSEKLPKFIDQGFIKDLTQIVKESQFLSNPDVIPAKNWDMIRIDNKIYGIPNKFEGGRLPIIREDWIKEFGIKDPITLDDWLNYWRFAKEKKNAYGLTTRVLYDIQPWASAFGLKDGYVIKDGKRTLPYASDKAAPFWDWMAKIYKLGYMDPNFAANTSANFTNQFITDKVASIGYWDAWVGLFNNSEITRYKEGKFIAKGVNGVPGADGKVILTAGDSSLWVVPYNAKNIDMAVIFLEFWHSPAGYIMGSVGIEGFDYTRDKVGKIVLTEIGKDHSCDHGAPRVLSTTWKPPFAKLPGVEAAEKIVSKYGTPMYKPFEWFDANEIIKYWAYKAIKGDILGKQAVINMRKELKERKLID